MATPAATTQSVIRAVDVGVYYGANQVIESVNLDIAGKRNHRYHRTQWRRQKHVAALHQPHE